MKSRRAMRVLAGGKTFTTGITYPDPGSGYDVWTFDVHADKPVLIQADSVNHTNTSCGIYKMYLASPDGTKTPKSKGVQPGVACFGPAGKWRLFLKMVEPCGDTHRGITVNVRY